MGLLEKCNEVNDILPPVKYERITYRGLADKYGIPLHVVAYYCDKEKIGRHDIKKVYFSPEDFNRFDKWAVSIQKMYEQAKNMKPYTIRELAEMFNTRSNVMHRYIASENLGIVILRQSYFSDADLQQIKTWRENVNKGLHLRHSYGDNSKTRNLSSGKNKTRENQINAVKRPYDPAKYLQRKMQKQQQEPKKIYYKVSVFDDGVFFVKHCGLTEAEAKQWVVKYTDMGICAKSSPHLRNKTNEALRKKRQPAIMV